MSCGGCRWLDGCQAWAALGCRQAAFIHAPKAPAWPRLETRQSSDGRPQRPAAAGGRVERWRTRPRPRVRPGNQPGGFPPPPFASSPGLPIPMPPAAAAPQRPAAAPQRPPRLRIRGVGGMRVARGTQSYRPPSPRPPHSCHKCQLSRLSTHASRRGRGRGGGEARGCKKTRKTAHSAHNLGTVPVGASARTAGRGDQPMWGGKLGKQGGGGGSHAAGGGRQRWRGEAGGAPLARLGRGVGWRGGGWVEGQVWRRAGGAADRLGFLAAPHGVAAGTTATTGPALIPYESPTDSQLGGRAWAGDPAPVAPRLSPAEAPRPPRLPYA